LQSGGINNEIVNNQYYYAFYTNKSNDGFNLSPLNISGTFDNLLYSLLEQASIKAQLPTEVIINSCAILAMNGIYNLDTFNTLKKEDIFKMSFPI